MARLGVLPVRQASSPLMSEFLEMRSKRHESLSAGLWLQLSVLARFAPSSRKSEPVLDSSSITEASGGMLLE
ncbi:hypothetical protein NHQ30_000288 [Ciborinia camelliae]|nr:hypothetical protein NHQ30_000288 [Ciborinia camelliae]